MKYHVPYQLGDTLSSYTNTISIFAKLERNWVAYIDANN